MTYFYKVAKVENVLWYPSQLNMLAIHNSQLTSHDLIFTTIAVNENRNELIDQIKHATVSSFELSNFFFSECDYLRINKFTGNCIFYTVLHTCSSPSCRVCHAAQQNQKCVPPPHIPFCNNWLTITHYPLHSAIISLCSAQPSHKNYILFALHTYIPK